MSWTGEGLQHRPGQSAVQDGDLHHQGPPRVLPHHSHQDGQPCSHGELRLHMQVTGLRFQSCVPSQAEEISNSKHPGKPRILHPVCKTVRICVLAPQLHLFPFQFRPLTTTFVHASLQWLIGSVMSSTLCPQVVSLAHQHFRLSFQDVGCLCCCGGSFSAQSVSWSFSLESGMFGMVDAWDFVRMAVKHRHLTVWTFLLLSLCVLCSL